jgi:hypothetical protein
MQALLAQARRILGGIDQTTLGADVMTMDPAPLQQLLLLCREVGARAMRAAQPGRADPADTDYADVVAVCYREWHQLALEHDTLLMHRFTYDRRGSWCEIQLMPHWMYALAKLGIVAHAELPPDPTPATLLGATLLGRHGGAPVLPADLLAVPVAAMRASQLIDTLRFLSQQWNNLVYSEELAALVEALQARAEVLSINIMTEREGHDVVRFRSSVGGLTPPAPPATGTPTAEGAAGARGGAGAAGPLQYRASPAFFLETYLILRDMFWALGSMQAQLPYAEQPASLAGTDAAAAMISDEEYANCVRFFRTTTKEIQCPDVPPLMEEHFLEDSLAPGEFRLWEAAHPHALPRVDAVVASREHHVDLLNQAQMFPDQIVARYLSDDRHAVQTVLLRFGLMCHLAFYVGTCMPQIEFAQVYLVPHWQYAERLAAMELATNDVFLVQLFNHWHVQVNGRLLLYNNLLEALCAWLKLNVLVFKRNEYRPLYEQVVRGAASSMLGQRKRGGAEAAASSKK